MMDVCWKNKVWQGISKNMETRSTEIHAHERNRRCPVFTEWWKIWSKITIKIKIYWREKNNKSSHE